MAHNLAYKPNGQTRMAYNGAGGTPWHGLGQTMEPGASIEEWIKQAGFDYSIIDKLVHYTHTDAQGVEHWLPVADRHVLHRDDTGAALSIVSGRYKIVQPQDVMEFFRDLCEDFGMEMETAGILGNGQKYWALAKTGESVKFSPTDQHDLYVLLATSCDGTLATIAKPTSHRPVCQNTLAPAIKYKGGKGLQVKHSSIFDPVKVKKALGLIDFSSTWDAYGEQMRQLQAQPVNESQATAYFSELLRPTDKRAAKRQELKASTFDELLQGAAGFGELTTVIQEQEGRAIRGLDELEQAYRTAPGAVPGSAYGLVQGVTRYVDHVRGKEQGKRLTSAWFGQGDQLKTRALSMAAHLSAG